MAIQAKRVKKILIIDDDPVTVKLLETRFKAHGYEVLTACDGMTGYEKARKEKPDLITLDVMMPELNGYSVCGFLKTDEMFRSIPIVMLTVRSSKNDKEFDDMTQPEAYLTKPFDTKELFETIEELIGK